MCYDNIHCTVCICALRKKDWSFAKINKHPGRSVFITLVPSIMSTYFGLPNLVTMFYTYT